MLPGHEADELSLGLLRAVHRCTGTKFHGRFLPVIVECERMTGSDELS